jgi:signal transduction histidine kinase
MLEGRNGLHFKLILSYLLTLTVVLGLVNIFPVTSFQQKVFRDKEKLITNRASAFCAELESAEELDTESAQEIIQLLNQERMLYVLVLDAQGNTLYASPEVSALITADVLSDHLTTVLTGNDVFQCRFHRSVFDTYLFQPIVRQDEVKGVLCVYERDDEQGGQLAQLIWNLRLVSSVIVAAVLVVSVLSGRSMSRRIEQLFQAVQKMNQGEFDSEPMGEGSDDELGTLTREMNRLMMNLDTSDRSQKDFFANLSHEMKTPLASIRLLTDSILNAENIDRETELEFLRDINAEVERLKRMTDSLAVLTRLESGPQGQSEVIDLRDTIQEVFRALMPQAHQATVKLESASNEAAWVRVSKDDSFQIVKNLVENGIKYNVPGGFVRATLNSDAEQVFLMIEDNGIGISENMQPKIFDRFFQAQHKDDGSNGLGLSIVWNAVKRWGGTLSVHAREEGGTCFQVALPKAELSPSAAPAPSRNECGVLVGENA